MSIRASMMSSRVQMHSLRLAVWLRTRSLALPLHTSVPWERPEMRIRSAMLEGLVSSRIPRTKAVPNSGMPRVPVVHPNCSWVSPRASGEVNRDSTFLSSSGMSR